MKEMTVRYQRALVRGVAPTFDRCIRPHGETEAIDVARAREQHKDYCEALARAGVGIDMIDPDEQYPDCCFVEDPAIVVGETAIVGAMAAVERRGEEVAVARVLNGMCRVVHLQPPATLDGGDVILAGTVLFVGQTARSNAHAVSQLGEILAPAGIRVVPVAVRDALHLKSAATAMGNDLVLVDPRRVDTAVFAGLRVIPVTPAESYAANCVRVNDTILVAAGFPRIAAMAADVAEVVIEVDTGEFRKGGGSLSCLSILLA